MEGEARSNLFIHQYISSQHETDFAKIELHSELLWNGKIEIKITSSAQFTLHLRLPSWSLKPQVKISGQDVVRNGTSYSQSIPHTADSAGYPFDYAQDNHPAPRSASGYDPCKSRFLSISRTWTPNDLIEINFDMPIQLRRAHPKVKRHRGKITITRGPLVYCLESTDNTNADIFNIKVDTASFQPIIDESMLNGIMKIQAKSSDVQQLTFIPYHLWGNRGPSQMTVWVNV
jgi:DUF1680 family protein